MGCPNAVEQPRPRLVTVHHTAKLLSLHSDTIREMIGKGTLIAVRQGRAVRVTMASIDRYLAEAEQVNGGAA